MAFTISYSFDGFGRQGNKVLGKYTASRKVKIITRNAGSYGGTEYFLMFNSMESFREFSNDVADISQHIPGYEDCRNWQLGAEENATQSEFDKAVGLKFRGVNWHDASAVVPVYYYGTWSAPDNN